MSLVKPKCLSSAVTCCPRATSDLAAARSLSPMCFSSRCPSACLRLKEAPKSPAALWVGFVLQRRSFWPFYPRRIAPFLRPCWTSVQLFWWPFQREEEDKCSACGSARPPGFGRIHRALYWSVSFAQLPLFISFSPVFVFPSLSSSYFNAGRIHTAVLHLGSLRELF